MPLRTYICLNGHATEVIGSPSTIECPKCGKEAKAKEWEVPARRNPDRGIQR